jgi:UDP-N-acetylglucosamine 2-epimerase (non-hydrolysing)
MIKVLVVLGTRPEAIKLAPVIRGLQQHGRFSVTVCATSQHREMLDQALQVFGIRSDWDLGLMKAGQDLIHITSAVLEGLRPVLAKLNPDWLLVQGDTTSAFAAALAAYYSHVAVGHVEAGLRTNDKRAPYPEEVNRRAVAVLADAHFAPTAWARDNLLRENVPAECIWVTGNTGIDALHHLIHRLSQDPELSALASRRFPFLDEGKRLILLTAHRRESFGPAMEEICWALRDIASARSDVQLVYPVHPNPNVRGPVETILGKVQNSESSAQRNLPAIGSLWLTEPLDYVSFVYLLQRAYCVVTDSGGVQEEAASLGKPVLILRNVTERPEGVQAGVARTVGVERTRIVSSLSRLLDDNQEYRLMATPTTAYGDGKAAERIAQALADTPPGH